MNGCPLHIGGAEGAAQPQHSAGTAQLPRRCIAVWDMATPEEATRDGTHSTSQGKRLKSQQPSDTNSSAVPACPPVLHRCLAGLWHPAAGLHKQGRGGKASDNRTTSRLVAVGRCAHTRDTLHHESTAVATSHGSFSTLHHNLSETSCRYPPSSRTASTRSGHSNKATGLPSLQPSQHTSSSSCSQLTQLPHRLHQVGPLKLDGLQARVRLELKYLDGMKG